MSPLIEQGNVEAACSGMQSINSIQRSGVMKFTQLRIQPVAWPLMLQSLGSGEADFCNTKHKSSEPMFENNLIPSLAKLLRKNLWLVLWPAARLSYHAVLSAASAISYQYVRWLKPEDPMITTGVLGGFARISP